MSRQEHQLNTSGLQSLEDEFSLTKQELDDFKKLPKAEREKRKNEKLTQLESLQARLDQAIQEAIKTGELDEANKLKDQLDKEVKDLEELMGKPKKEIAGISLELVDLIRKFNSEYVELNKIEPDNKTIKIFVLILQYYIFPELGGEKSMNMREIGEKCHVSAAWVQVKKEVLLLRLRRFINRAYNPDVLAQELNKILAERGIR